MTGKLKWVFISFVTLLIILTAAVSARPDEFSVSASTTTSEGETSIYIVRFADPPLASYRGGIAGLEATNPGVRGEVKLDAQSESSLAYLTYLDQRHSQVEAAMTAALGRQVDVKYRYRYAYNGMAVALKEPEVSSVMALPYVVDIERERVLELETDNGPAWIGAEAIWNGSGTGGLKTKGEGVVVGVIDTGINYSHPSFAQKAKDDYVHDNPRDQYYGLCDPVSGLPFCNQKLIGVYDYTGSSPVDDHGHGSHTASTAAGNPVEAVVQAPTTTITRTLSGVAPRANLISYKVCSTPGCLSPDITMAIDQATADAVDVINFSIGGSSRDPWTGAMSLAYLGARDGGVFAATSAGNSGPHPRTVGTPADAPWIMSVGASTHDRAIQNSLVDLTGGETAPPADIIGKSLTSGYGPAPIVYAGDYGDAECLRPFALGTFSGEIVVCDRGTNPRVEKGRNVQVGGAGGMILANDEDNGNSLIADGHHLPAVHITYEDGVILKEWLATGEGHTGTIAGTVAYEDPALGDIMAAFSSRGENPSVPSIIKPDITAPGVDILAAISGPSETGNPPYGLMSGTSMSSPHVAGAGALIRAARPEWTPAEIQSALMTTALTEGVLKEDGVTASDPFDRGSGRVDLTKAARAGLVLNEVEPNYTDANPATGGDPTSLNLASLGHADCAGRCSWTRTVRSTHDTPVTWTVSTSQAPGLELTVTPSSFELAPGITKTIKVEADVSGLRFGEWVFGEVTLTPNVGTVPAAHLPVAVLPGGMPRLIEIETPSSVGMITTTITPTVDIEDFTAHISGLTQGHLITGDVSQDPTNMDPYDSGDGTYHMIVEVGEGAPLLSAAILETLSPDLDLYVGLDKNGDGQPSADEQICRSATATSDESCLLLEPEPGTYWIMVQNWLGTGSNSFTLEVVNIEGTDNGNLTVSGPDNGAAGTPTEIEIGWHECAMDAGEVWFGIAQLASQPSKRVDVASLLVRIERLESEETCQPRDDNDGGTDGGDGDGDPSTEPQYLWHLPMMEKPKQ